MIEVNGLVIEVTPQQLITDLKVTMEKQGLFYFKKIKPAKDNIQFSCPFHADGQESHPSCGISITSAQVRGRIIPAGTVHCFTCGYTAQPADFVSNLFGRMDGGFYGNQWLKKNYTTGSVIVREPLRLNMSRQADKIEVKKINYISEEVLDSYRCYHDYMWERGLNEDIVEQFDIGYDANTKCLTFPVYDNEGRVPFVQTRSVGVKFHHYEEGVDKTDYLYGEYQLREYAKTHQVDEVGVVESALNCHTLWINGIPSVALMGVGGGKQFELLKNLPGRSLLLGMDPDEAGIKSSENIKRQLRRHKIIRRFDYPKYCYDNGMDINKLGAEILNISIVLN